MDKKITKWQIIECYPALLSHGRLEVYQGDLMGDFVCGVDIHDGAERERLELACTAVNACKEINPENPLVVAENIEKMYSFMNRLYGFSKLIGTPDAYDPEAIDIECGEVLSAIKGGE